MFVSYLVVRDNDHIQVNFIIYVYTRAMYSSVTHKCLVHNICISYCFHVMCREPSGKDVLAGGRLEAQG